MQGINAKLDSANKIVLISVFSFSTIQLIQNTKQVSVHLVLYCWILEGEYGVKWRLRTQIVFFWTRGVSLSCLGSRVPFVAPNFPSPCGLVRYYVSTMFQFNPETPKYYNLSHLFLSSLFISAEAAKAEFFITSCLWSIYQAVFNLFLLQFSLRLSGMAAKLQRPTRVTVSVH